MQTRNTRAIAWMMASALSLSLLGCAGDSPGVSGVSGSGGTTGPAVAQILPGIGFVASSFGFYYPDDGVSGIEGFDLDGRASSSDSPGVEECAHDDWTGPNQEPGIDYGFLASSIMKPCVKTGSTCSAAFTKGNWSMGSSAERSKMAR